MALVGMVSGADKSTACHTEYDIFGPSSTSGNSCSPPATRVFSCSQAAIALRVKCHLILPTYPSPQSLQSHRHLLSLFPFYGTPLLLLLGLPPIFNHCDYAILQECRHHCERNGDCLKWTLELEKHYCWLKGEGGERREAGRSVVSGTISKDRTVAFDPVEVFLRRLGFNDCKARRCESSTVKEQTALAK